MNEHDGTYETEEQIIDGLEKRIVIANGELFGIAMFAIDLGTV